MAFSRNKIYEKKVLGIKFDQNGPKSRPKLGFWKFSQVWLINFQNFVGQIRAEIIFFILMSSNVHSYLLIKT